MNEVPEIETPRLTLRGHRVEDLDDSAAMWADARVTRYIGGKPFSRAECWSRLLRHAGHWSVLGFGYWVVRERTTERFVGEVGFADLKREIEPAFDGTPEIGWALTPSAHGRGFATEAVSAAIAWGDRRLESARTVCLIDPGNGASIRVASKCGYRETLRTTYKGDAVMLFERARPSS